MNEALEEIQVALKLKGFRFDPALMFEEKPRGVIEAVAKKYTRLYLPYLVYPEPQWLFDNVTSLGLERVVMNRKRFGFLMHSFFKQNYFDKDGS
jgi:hypothetical protein